MTEINFTEVSDIDEFEPVPEGTYSCSVEDAEETATTNGDPRWKLTFAIEEGDHADRLVWDNLVFSPRALPRAKYALSALGFEVSGSVELSRESLVGRRCRLSIFTEEWEGKMRNKVHFRGYEPAGENADGTPF